MRVYFNFPLVIMDILFIIVNRYIYALLKDTFGNKVRLLYTNTDSFFLYFTVDNLTQTINARSQLRIAFDFSEIEHTHNSQLRGPGDKVHGGEVGLFKGETKGDPIVEFVALRLKMY